MRSRRGWLLRGVPLALLALMPTRGATAEDAGKDEKGESAKGWPGKLDGLCRAVQRSIHDAHGEDCTDAAEGDAMPTI